MKKALVALCVLFLTGCFEVEQSINLKKDLSGTADFHLGIDMEPMVIVMAQFGREMEGKKGPMTDAEIAAAKADFKKQAKKKTSEEKMPSREEMQKSMPEGVKLLDFAMTEKDFGIASDFKFAFENIRNLIDVKLPSNGEGDPTKKNIIDTPFEALQLVEKGDTITLQTKPVNPAESVKEQASDAPKLDPGMEKMVKQAFEKMRVVYRINAPFTIVSHNATRREGDTLIWEYDMKRFEELAKSKKPDDFQVRVTYKK
ncbi:MAG TPA: hypothetical protein VJZ00_08265 [Thermoanaerobaculia bacterium]|nr:hypothetical protein [Thermoanaerobaculia bacterium]